jgi:hypothetical protein
MQEGDVDDMVGDTEQVIFITRRRDSVSTPIGLAAAY